MNSKPNLSFIIPVFNEEENINNTITRVINAYKNELGDENYEMIFVNDGSTDKTQEILFSQNKFNPKIKSITLSRNFGHQAALCAGLMHADGNYIAVLDGDLQDPPEIAIKFLEYCEKGYDLVYGVRRKRKEGLLKRICYGSFYKLITYISQIEIPQDSGDFCLMNRRFLEELNSLPEKNRFIRGLRAHIGFRQIGVEYERSARAAGEPKYNFRKLLRLASDGIFNFSDRPLKISTALGFIISSISLIISILIVLQKILNIPIFGIYMVPGYATITIGLFFLSGIQLFSIGILGEYISRIFLEVKRRPIYIIKETCGINKKGYKI